MDEQEVDIGFLIYREDQVPIFTYTYIILSITSQIFSPLELTFKTFKKFVQHNNVKAVSLILKILSYKCPHRFTRVHFLFSILSIRFVLKIQFCSVCLLKTGCRQQLHLSMISINLFLTFVCKLKIRLGKMCSNVSHTFSCTTVSILYTEHPFSVEVFPKWRGRGGTARSSNNGFYRLGIREKFRVPVRS